MTVDFEANHIISPKVILNARRCQCSEYAKRRKSFASVIKKPLPNTLLAWPTCMCLVDMIDATPLPSMAPHSRTTGALLIPFALGGNLDIIGNVWLKEHEYDDDTYEALLVVTANPEGSVIGSVSIGLFSKWAIGAQIREAIPSGYSVAAMDLKDRDPWSMCADHVSRSMGGVAHWLMMRYCPSHDFKDVIPDV